MNNTPTSFPFDNRMVYGTSTRADGNMSLNYGSREEVLANREAFASRIDIKFDDTLMLKSQHLDNIILVSSIPSRGTEDVATMEGEALITNVRGIHFAILTADCYPVVFYDPENSVVALAHLGWRPSEKNLIAKVVGTLVREFRCAPDNIQVSFGPGIHKDSYLLDRVEQTDKPAWSSYLTRTLSGKVSVDLLGYNVEQLEKSNVLRKNIFLSNVDTATSDTFFSHYAHRHYGSPGGRFMTVIGLRTTQ